MIGTKSNLKLLAGKLLAAWREYPTSLKAYRRFPEGPPIFVTGTHRSGTTWVARMLAPPGVWYIHEPFYSGKGLWPENFTYLRPGQLEPRVDRIMNRILHGGHRFALQHPWADHPMMPVRLLPPPKIRRLLLKDPIACLMSDYLTDRFGLETLVLFRHPAGFASGLVRLGWPIAMILRRFLECDALIEDWLHPYRDLIESAADEDNLFSASVLYGCLNVPLWGFTGRNPRMQAVSFETLCNEPIDEFRRLYQKLNLPYDNRIEAMHADLCFSKSSNGNYRTHEVRRNSAEMAFRWRREMSPAELSEVRAVWRRFDVPLYQQDADW